MLPGSNPGQAIKRHEATTEITAKKTILKCSYLFIYYLLFTIYLFTIYLCIPLSLARRAVGEITA